MKNPKRMGGSLDTRKYLAKFDGLDIKPIFPENPHEETEVEIIVLDKWVRHDFPDMGFTSYDEVDPP